MKEDFVTGIDNTTAIAGSFIFVLSAEHLQGIR